MSKAVRWQVPFVSTIDHTKYRIDIYAEDDGSWDHPEQVQLLGGPQPFVTEEHKSDDFFTPVRSQTGNIQVCTAIPEGGILSLDEIMPANNIDRPIRLVSIDANDTETVEWVGFLSCEAYSQDYTAVPEVISLPVISVLEAMKSVELSLYWFNQIGSDTVSGFISDILWQLSTDNELDLTCVFSQSSNDILTKYIFCSQYFSYEQDEATGTFSFIYKGAYIYDVFTDICKFMGWVLREKGNTLYFIRNWSDELGMTSVNMSNLVWRGKDNKRNITQGAKKVSVEAEVSEFKTYFEMPKCPLYGLNERNEFTENRSWQWYYDKCTQAVVFPFTSESVADCFLCRFYGITNYSAYIWNRVYKDVGFSNAIYIKGFKHTGTYDDNYTKRCTISSVIDFSVICGIANSLEDAGSFVLRIKDEVAAKLGVDGSIRCGMKFNGSYYNQLIGWVNNPLATIKVEMSNGSGELKIPLPKINSVYTFVTSEIELYFYDDFDNTKTSAVISDVSISYEPPFRKDSDSSKKNRYVTKLSGFNDEVNMQLNLASSFGNANGLSHIYGVHRYEYGGGEYADYLEPITSIDYLKANNTTESRRPEVDLLNRLASYYGAARTNLELKVAHPTVAVLPLLKLNGINDGKVYLPLAESRDWKQDTSTLKCFEVPETPSES